MIYLIILIQYCFEHLAHNKFKVKEKKGKKNFKKIISLIILNI